MIWVAIAGLLLGLIASSVAAGTCLRPALRLRAIGARLPIHPVLQVERPAVDALRDIDAALARMNVTHRRFGAAAASLHEAAASAAGYAEQVAIVAFSVDGLLSLLVPRLRGTLD